jgi:hypothetical protein
MLDIIFDSSYFFLDMPVQALGAINAIEAPTTWFELRIALPERISIG